MMNKYSKFFKSKWMLFSLTVSIILAVVILSSQGATAYPQEDVTVALWVEDKNFGVSYGIGVDNLAHEVIGRIEYDHDTAADIEQYRAFNYQELAKILENTTPAESIPMKITLSSPLNQEEFTSFVKQQEIEVESYIIYMLESDGKIATIQGGPSETELVPTEFFNTATSSVSEYSPGVGAQFVGWVEVRGDVQVSRVSQLMNDPQVFFVDVMELFLEAKLTDEVLAAAGYGRRAQRELLQAGYAYIDYPTVTGWAYHLGLMDLETQE